MGIVVDPAWYFYSMHFTAMLTTPINFIGVLIILFCQKSQLASLRWHLLTYQIMVFVSIFITAGSVELLFFLRYQAILPHSHPYKLTTLISVILVSLYQVVLITIMIISFHSAVPDQEVARAQFTNLYPELQYLVIDEHVYFVCVIVELVHVIFLFSCFFRLGLGMITVILLIWMSNISLHRFDLSAKTRKIHLQLIRNLCYQVGFCHHFLVLLYLFTFYVIPHILGYYQYALFQSSLSTLVDLNGSKQVTYHYYTDLKIYVGC
ncbi:hypothetical protein CRE_05090 [Caenorhabditis remanei]|uniref:Uncharacterized protein n=1 Tax=Caenorhabditis remanei TaxID=31234 RepID=E3MZ50_CAERE|nr:hypothetical protein CRE_05090 [Caenorhabditis remanei]